MSRRGGGGGGGGRGAYYKAKYGGGRGRSRDHDAKRRADTMESAPVSRTQMSRNELYSNLRSIDRQSYGQYKNLQHHSYLFPEFELIVDRVQSDPFAPPSMMHVIVPPNVADLPRDLHNSSVRATALSDYLARAFCRVASGEGVDVNRGGSWSGSKGGAIEMARPSQHVLRRTNVMLRPSGAVEARFTVSLPARGRSIEGHRAAEILCNDLPRVISASLLCSAHDLSHMTAHVNSIEDQEALRCALEENGLCAFVANDALLPRASGVSDLPMKRSDAVLFKSPPSMQTTISVPHAGDITGMGIRKGITLITGGGFHGKTTLLKALEVGVYNHVPGDGREFVAVSPTAVKIRAEDGRAIENVDISPFIDNLPMGKPTSCFRTEDASGSTSQAANIMEALEVGSDLLLVDEDQCATNFMMRDRRMELLVHKNNEPITPFFYQARSLYLNHGVSNILVVGGLGSYFSIADAVVMLRNYECFDVTERAKQIETECPLELATTSDTISIASADIVRFPLGSSIRAALSGRDKIKVLTYQKIGFGDSDIDLGAVDQLVEKGQAATIGDFLKESISRLSGEVSLKQVLEEGTALIHTNGLDGFFSSRQFGGYSEVRPYELAAAFNRLRTLKVKRASEATT